MYLHINQQKNAIHRRKFGDNNMVTAEVKTWLWQIPEFLQKGLHALVFRWHEDTGKNGQYLKNNNIKNGC
jgi:hypothetical protein